ncbi:MAG: hypothetical protein K8W52_27235 [Deltaproteobacteria bacterium]|nr:hypothetical protein [Deltaproteobacteria bacterium]
MLKLGSLGLACAIVAGGGCGATHEAARGGAASPGSAAAGALAPTGGDAPLTDAAAMPAGTAAAPLTFATVPDFGCFARSTDGRVIACVVGQRGFNIGPSRVELVFVASDDRPIPSSIVLLENEGETRGDDALPPAVIAQVTAALRGMVGLERGGPHVVATRGDARASTTPAITVGGLTIGYATRAAAPTGQAPAFHTTLSVRRGQAAEVLDDGDKITPTVEARAFAVGDTVVVEQLHGIGDEGTFGDYGAAWRCGKDACAPISGE